MIFTSYEFLFGFLPAVMFGYFCLSLFKNKSLCKIWLVLASLFFYGFWDWNYIYLITASILLNFILGRAQLSEGRHAAKKLILWAAVVLNLLLLGYFKYLNFFLDNIGFLTSGYQIEKIILPIGLSFYTFQQISYQVDSYTGKSERYSFLDYSLFVSFFPQLIAGPIVHHSEMLPQFNDKKILSLKSSNVLMGLCVLAMGVFKKSVLADSFATYANPIFSNAESPANVITFLEAWIATVAFGFQLYFDFSGYSDMAIGLALIFGINLPFNFFSPLKAKNMIEFWRRWHISLTREVNSLLYNPISLNSFRRAAHLRLGRVGTFVLAAIIPTLFVWLIVGAWHGAGWTFILMGLLFGACIAFNHICDQFIYKNRTTPILKKITAMPAFVAIISTFFAYLMAIVLFRAESLSGAASIYSSLFSIDAKIFTSGDLIAQYSAKDLMLFLAGAMIIWVLPNSVQYFAKFDIGIDVFGWRKVSKESPVKWSPNLRHVFFCALLGMIGVMFIAQNVQEFIYFDF